MPTYDYRCPNGHDFEHFYRKMSEATAELACPVCGVVAERRVSGGAGLVFKGSGFYLTDYGRNAHRGSGSNHAKSDGKGGEKSESAGGAGKAEAGSGSAAPASERASGSSPGSPKSDSNASTSPPPKSKGGESE